MSGACLSLALRVEVPGELHIGKSSSRALGLCQGCLHTLGSFRGIAKSSCFLEHHHHPLSALAHCHSRVTPLKAETRSFLPSHGMVSYQALLESKMGTCRYCVWGCPDIRKCCFTEFLSGDAAVSLLAEAHSTHPQGAGEKTFPRRRQAHTFGVLDHTQKNCIRMEPFLFRRKGTRSNN